MKLRQANQPQIVRYRKPSLNFSSLQRKYPVQKEKSMKMRKLIAFLRLYRIDALLLELLARLLSGLIKKLETFFDSLTRTVNRLNASK